MCIRDRIRTAPENPLKTGDTAYLSFPPQRGFLFDEQGRTLFSSSPQDTPDGDKR